MTDTLPESAEVVIIGGGIMGLALAYELGRRGQKGIVVLEKSYLCSGASGRNGGGVRAQWSSEDNVRLMKQSVEICRDFATEMRINIWFRQGGYLFLARNEARAEQLERSVELQRTLGVTSKLLTPEQAQKVVPELDPSRLVTASYNPDDGVVFPWPFVWGYARGAQERGTAVFPFTTVTGIDVTDGSVSAVVTDRGTIRAPLVVNAAGAWSPELARWVGVDLPNHPHRHEICSTEPLKPFLKPLVADLDSGLYFSQSMRGEIVGGISNPDVPEGIDMGSSDKFLSLYAKALVRTMPILGSVRVLRQWAGCYDITPDGAPILGPVDAVGGFWQMSGFMGHGFMIAPIIARIMAQRIVGQNVEEDLFRKWNFRRFEEGNLLSETMILG